jgi:hypothetical protein
MIGERMDDGMGWKIKGGTGSKSGEMAARGNLSPFKTRARERKNKGGEGK